MKSNDMISDRHGSAVITLPSDTEYLVTRVFDAPADLREVDLDLRGSLVLAPEEEERLVGEARLVDAEVAEARGGREPIDEADHDVRLTGESRLERTELTPDRRHVAR